MSYAGAPGHVIAKRTRVRFLTEDDTFDGVENVKFVK